MESAASFYKAGGTLEVSVRSYVVRRQADDELERRIRERDFCYVLTARQMGKSSLMVRTAQRLQKSADPAERWHVAVVDLTPLGGKSVKVTADAWYFGIASTIAHELELLADVDDWWAKRSAASPVLRLHEFLRDVVLKNTTGPVVVFVDEIDSTLSLDFTDDFFAMIRACYNSRATDPEYSRLVFVLLGVAAPADLIKDAQRTPFNIGTRIDLTDFTLEEAQTLAAGLGGDLAMRQAALKRILEWTDGHPYLTQKVCQTAAGRGQDEHSPVTPERVDRVVESLFAPGSERTDDNLKRVRDQVIGRGHLTRQILTLYRSVLAGKKVLDDPVYRAASELKLSGLVKVQDDGTYKIRNRIYERVFGAAWVKKEWPPRGIVPLVAGVPSMTLILGLLCYYVFVYPLQFIDTLEHASPADARLAGEAHDRLRTVWFRAGQAGRLWGEYNLKRARVAIELDLSPENRLAPFQMAGEAYREGLHIPEFADRSAQLYAEFFKGRAERAAFQEQRDDAILWWRRALSVRPSDSAACRAAEELTGYDYKALIRTVRLVSLAGTSRRPIDVVAGCLSADGRKYVGWSREGVGMIWSLPPDTTPDVRDYNGPSPSSGRAPIALAVSRDGLRLAVLRSRTVEVSRLDSWTFPPYSVLKIPPPSLDSSTGPEKAMLASVVTLSADGRRVAVAGDEGIVWTWDVDRPDLPPEPYLDRESQGPIRALTFSPDGRRLAAGGDDQVVRVWDLGRSKDQPVKLRDDRAFEGRGERILALAFTPDGHRLAAGGAGQAAKVWDLEQPGRSPLVLLGDMGPIRFLQFAPDGRRLAGAGRRAVRVWNAGNPTGAILRFEAEDPPITGLAWTDEGRLVTGDTCVVRFWDPTRSGTGDSPGLSVPAGRVVTAALSTGGKRLAAGSDTGDVVLWELDKPEQKPVVLKTRRGEIRALAFSPDDRLLASGGASRTIQVWKLDPTGTPALDLPELDTGGITVMILGSDRRLISGGSDGRVRIWDLERPASQPMTLQHFDPGSRALALSSDGAQMAYAGDDGMIWVFRVEKPGGDPSALLRLVARLPAVDLDPSATPQAREPSDTSSVGSFDDRPRVTSLAFDPEGHRLVAGRSDGETRIWSLRESGYVPVRLPAHKDAVVDVGFSKDGAAVLTATRLWLHHAWTRKENHWTFETHLLPADYLAAVPVASRVSGDAGAALQLALRTAPGQIHPAQVQFDGRVADGSASGPCPAMGDWEEKLGLTIDEKGEIVRRPPSVTMKPLRDRQTLGQAVPENYAP